MKKGYFDMVMVIYNNNQAIRRYKNIMSLLYENEENQIN